MTTYTDRGVFLNMYFETLFRRIEMIAELSSEDKQKIVEKALAKLSPIPLRIENNYKNAEMEVTSEGLLERYFVKKPTMSGYGVMFKQNAVNAPGKILEYLISQRKVVKKKMFQHANDPDKTLYNVLDVEQKVIKVLANAFYGAFGQSSFHFFNPVLGPSVTYSGQNVTLSAILGFEAFMTGNFSFFDFDETLVYIDNIQREPLLELTIRTRPTTVKTVKNWLVRHCRFEITENHDAFIDSILDGMNEYELERLYMKNNLFAMLGTETIRQIFEKCYDREYLNADHPTEGNKEAVETLNEYFRYFLSYPYQWKNKFDRINGMRRRCVIISDTDSTFLNINPVVEWYQKKINGEEVLDKIGRVVVCNIMVNSITKYIEQVFWELTKNMNIPEERRKLIQMKSEFNYSRIILTKNKKQYAGIIVSQEGTLLEKPKFDIKGLDIKKVKTPKIARTYFGQILEKDMLLAPKIEPMSVFMKFIEFEKQIHDSLSGGETKFSKPGKFSSASGYKNPGTIQSYRGVVLWNMMYPKKSVPDFSNVNLLKLKKINRDNYREMFPEEFHEVVERYFETEIEIKDKAARERAEAAGKTTFGDYGIDVVAVPKTETMIPEVFRPLIDTTSIIDANMKNGNILLESLGFKVIKSQTQNSISNIIEI